MQSIAGTEHTKVTFVQITICHPVHDPLCHHKHSGCSQKC